VAKLLQGGLQILGLKTQDSAEVYGQRGRCGVEEALHLSEHD